MIKKITAITLLSAVLFSCSTSNEVVSNGFFQKRKYNKGWYANKSSKVKSSKEEQVKDVYATQEELATNNSEEIKGVSNKEEVKPISREYITKQDVVVKPAKYVLASTNFAKEEKIVSTSKIIVQEQDAVVLEELKQVAEVKPLKVDGVDSKNASDAGVALLLLVILAIILPPLAVFLVDGIGNKFWISLILTLLFWLPGMIYALLVVFGAV